MRPLIRWTMGNAIHQGLLALRESVISAIDCLGKDNFRWLICSNATESHCVRFIEEIAAIHGIEIRLSKRSEFPLDSVMVPSGRTREASGSFWKICPPRLAMDTHEIILDNDVIVRKRFSEIDEFLASDKTLVLEEDTSYHGRYFFLFNPDEKFNSGILGYPPGYDMQQEICKYWRELGAFKVLNGGGDEQGLVTYTILQHPHIVIPKEKIVQVFAEGKCVHAVNRVYWDKKYKCWTHGFKQIEKVHYEVTGKEEGFHFCEANRLQHGSFESYLGFKQKAKRFLM